MRLTLSRINYAGLAKKKRKREREREKETQNLPKKIFSGAFIE